MLARCGAGLDVGLGVTDLFQAEAGGEGAVRDLDVFGSAPTTSHGRLVPNGVARAAGTVTYGA